MRSYPFRIAAVFGLLSVILGAFGAHALKGQLIENNSVEVWKTAVDYQMWHALVLLAIGLYPAPPVRHTAACTCFSLGILLFSGSLYWLALEGPRWLGPITPIGGLLLIIGWGLLLKASFSKQKNEAV